MDRLTLFGIEAGEELGRGAAKFRSRRAGGRCCLPFALGVWRRAHGGMPPGRRAGQVRRAACGTGQGIGQIVEIGGGGAALAGRARKDRRRGSKPLIILVVVSNGAGRHPGAGRGSQFLFHHSMDVGARRAERRGGLSDPDPPQVTRRPDPPPRVSIASPKGRAARLSIRR